MVSLQKPETAKVVSAVEVKHLMTEEQAAPPVSKAKSSRANDATQLKEVNQRLEKAEKEAEQWEQAFAWAVCLIFVLLFVITLVCGAAAPDNSAKSTILTILQVLFASAAIATFLTNIVCY